MEILNPTVSDPAPKDRLSPRLPTLDGKVVGYIYSYGGERIPKRIEEILSERPEVLDKLRSLWAEHHSVTLLCFERVPPAEHCHRFVLIDILGSS